MLEGILSTLNPKGGHGMMETVIFLVLILALVYMNVAGIEINETFNYVITTIVGYMVGTNAKKIAKPSTGVEVNENDKVE